MDVVLASITDLTDVSIPANTATIVTANYAGYYRHGQLKN